MRQAGYLRAWEGRALHFGRKIQLLLDFVIYVIYHLSMLDILNNSTSFFHPSAFPHLPFDMYQQATSKAGAKDG